MVTGALVYQASKLINCSPAFYNEPMMRLADKLAVHSGLDKVFFANSGAEANEGAIKLARKYGALHRHGAYEIITFDGGFHGRTLATMSASGKKAFEPLFEPKVSGFPKAELNDLDSVKRLISDKTVAVLLEPIHVVEIVCPTDATAKINAILSARRGQILGFDTRDGWPGWDCVRAMMPEAEIGELIVELRSATAGAGSFTRQFDRMAEVTGRAADQIIAAHRVAA